MADKPFDGGPAFPTLELRDGNGNGIVEAGYGMALRDYFAAHCPITFTEFMTGWKRPKEATTSEALFRFAEFRFQYADEMIAARETSELPQSRQPDFLGE